MWRKHFLTELLRRLANRDRWRPAGNTGRRDTAENRVAVPFFLERRYKDTQSRPKGISK